MSPTMSMPCRGRRGCASQSGLTLLEVLVSTSILAVILSLLYGAYHAQMLTTGEVEDMGRINQTARVILERMTKDFESMVIRLPDLAAAGLLGMESEDRVEDGSPADRIHFTSLSHLEPGDPRYQTDLCEIGYTLEPDPEGPGFVLMRMDDPTLDGDMRTGGATMEIGRSIGGLDFVFEDDAGNTFHEWRTSDLEQGGKPPSVITISVMLLDRTGRGHRYETSVGLPLIRGWENEESPIF